MSALGDHTRAIQQRGDKALVAFLTAGFPDVDTFRDLVRSCADAGCDVIEIGVPFSDPIADGPLIQESSARAISQGITLSGCLELARELRTSVDCPLVFMSYYNPILRMGPEKFAASAAAAGVAGAIIPDMSYEESGDARRLLAEHGLSYIDLVAPTSSDERIARAVAEADGFVYLVSVTGVTGVRSPRAGDIEPFAARVRRHTDLPLYIGFGISDAEKAREAARVADGVIIGSALVRLIKSTGGGAAAARGVRSFLTDVRSALASARG